MRKHSRGTFGARSAQANLAQASNMFTFDGSAFAGGRGKGEGGITTDSAQALRKLREIGPRKHFAQANHMSRLESGVFSTAQLTFISMPTHLSCFSVWFRVLGFVRVEF